MSEEISYMVNFSGAKGVSEHQLRLTFFGYPTPLRLEDGAKVIPGINRVLGNSGVGYNISNIQDVIPNFEGFARNEYSTFNVLLFNEKSVQKPSADQTNILERKGFLFGVSKEKGLQVLGVWPYHYFEQIKDDIKKSREKIVELITKPEPFFEVLFLNMK